LTMWEHIGAQVNSDPQERGKLRPSRTSDPELCLLTWHKLG
jgi:hypothetical protein